ncbi:mariner transposase [Trichonephila clavipes]|nr:mariner transposase [Trichonephila clavipes]
MDETWIHCYTLESKISPADWTAADETCPKRSKTQRSAGKAMASVFWDAHGIVLIENLEKRETLSSDYYMTLLVHLNEKIKDECPQMQKKKKCCFTKTMLRATSLRKE